MQTKKFEERLATHKGGFHKVVPYEEDDKFLLMDFTERNIELTDEILVNTDLFTRYINKKLKVADARYGIGGYNEHRTVYSRSKIFSPSTATSTHAQDGAKTPSRWEGEEDRSYTAKTEQNNSLNKEHIPILNSPPAGGEQGAEPRRLHLGIDIWGKPYTKVMAPLDGIIHSFAFNNAFGDYGVTIILTHRLEDISFHTLYGHLSLNSIKNIQEGELVKKGDVFAEFGIPFENGQWPPHLHFQIVIDMQGMKGDYPGVCKYSDKEKYLANSPDPDLIIGMMG